MSTKDKKNQRVTASDMAAKKVISSKQAKALRKEKKAKKASKRTI